MFNKPATALVPDLFCNFYLVKIYKIANNPATTEAREKISTYLESLEFYKHFDLWLTKFENYQILLNKISHRFLMTTKLFIGWKSLIKNWKVLIFWNSGAKCKKSIVVQNKPNLLLKIFLEKTWTLQLYKINTNWKWFTKDTKSC